MKSIEEMGLMLGSSLVIQECVGDWKNSVRIGEENCPYSILLLLDYNHLYFHIGISIAKYNVSLVGEIKNIVDKAFFLAQKVNKQRLGGKTIHFTGKVFVITNEANVELQDEEISFKGNNLSLTVYVIANEKLVIKSPNFVFTPAEFYAQKEPIKETSILYKSSDYMIYEEDDHTVTYLLSMSYPSGYEKQIERQKDIGKLTPYKQDLDKYSVTNNQKKKNVSVLALSLRDTFEGSLQTAIESLNKMKDQRKEENITRISVYSIIIGILILSSIFVLMNTFLISQKIYLTFIASGVFGSILSIYFPFTFIPSIAHYSSPRIIVELILRFIIGGASGFIVYLAIKANILLGVVDSMNNQYLTLIVTIAAGWSQKFIPKLLERISPEA